MLLETEKEKENEQALWRLVKESWFLKGGLLSTCELLLAVANGGIPPRAPVN